MLSSGSMDVPVLAFGGRCLACWRPSFSHDQGGTDETFEAVWRQLFACVALGNHHSGQSGFSTRVDRSEYRHGTEKLLVQVPLREQTHEYDCWHPAEYVEMKRQSNRAPVICPGHTAYCCYDVCCGGVEA
jgi:hypothetical protein